MEGTAEVEHSPQVEAAYPFWFSVTGHDVSESKHCSHYRILDIIVRRACGGAPRTLPQAAREGAHWTLCCTQSTMLPADSVPRAVSGGRCASPRRAHAGKAAPEAIRRGVRRRGVRHASTASSLAALNAFPVKTKVATDLNEAHSLLLRHERDPTNMYKRELLVV